MEVTHLIDGYSYVGDVISFISCVALLFVIHWVLYYSKDRKFQLIKRAIFFIMAGTMLNFSFGKMCEFNMFTDGIALFVVRSLYHFCFMCCMYLFLLYMKTMLVVRGRLILHATYFTRAVFVICLILDVTSPITHLGFYRVGNLYYDGIISPYNIFYVYGVVVLLIMMIGYSDRLIRSVKYCLLATEIILVLIMTYCAAMDINTYTSFTYVLPIFVVMILLHSKPYDDLTGALGEGSLDKYLDDMAGRGLALDYMILELNLNAVPQLPQELGKVLNSFWHNSFKNATLFQLRFNTYLLAIPRTEKNGDTEAKIRNLMNSAFVEYYEKYSLPYKVIGLFDIDFIRNSADAKGIITYLTVDMDDNTYILSDDALREKLRICRYIKDNLEDIEQKGDLDDPRVLVYCQPIKNVKTGKYDTAESLMRMSIPDVGFVTPDLFIPIAENYNHIHSLSQIMLHKVCRQVKALEKAGYQFSRISVNFSMMEIRKDDFCEGIINIVKESGVDFSKIGIELTETETESDFKIVVEKIKALRDAGMTVYLDDIGTGYSNIDRIVQYDVDVVKFDRFILLAADQDPRIIKMTQHLSKAFQDLNYTILFEGVETDDNEQFCLDCGAQYLQGYKYSKPIPVERLEEFFEK